MLFDFHQRESQKKPGSVHATYLLDGLVVVEAPAVNGSSAGGDEDSHMQSSPFVSSSAPQPTDEEEPAHRHCVVIAKEEDLEGWSNIYLAKNLLKGRLDQTQESNFSPCSPFTSTALSLAQFRL